MRFPRHATAPAPQLNTFECSNCANTQNSLDRNIPVGWSVWGTSVLCDDCTASGIARQKRIARKAAR